MKVVGHAVLKGRVHRVQPGQIGHGGSTRGPTGRGSGRGDTNLALRAPTAPNSPEFNRVDTCGVGRGEAPLAIVATAVGGSRSMEGRVAWNDEAEIRG